MAVGGKGARPADWPGARPHVCGVLLGVGAVGGGVHPRARGVVAWGPRGSSASVARSWHPGDVRQIRAVEQFTRCVGNALDSKALHCLLPSAMLR